jgi:hypothetical protein
MKESPEKIMCRDLALYMVNHNSKHIEIPDGPKKAKLVGDLAQSILEYAEDAVAIEIGSLD